MNNRVIKTYEDLEQEEKRLTGRLVTLKASIQEDVTSVKGGLKDKLNPVKKIKATVRNMFVRENENGPAINFALNFVLDFIIRLFIPNRTNIFTKTIIPFVAKNYVSNMVTAEQRQSVLRVVNGAIGKIDQFISKSAEKRQEAQHRAEVAKAPVYTPPVTNMDTNPMGL